MDLVDRMQSTAPASEGLVPGLGEMTPGYRPTFVDLFAGAGGLSLGLMAAGLNGLFAVEREVNAFATLKANLLDGSRGLSFNWPAWLPRENIGIESLLDDYGTQLEELRGRVDLLAGGPPCQGFSTAGRRRQADPRNQLFEMYARVAEVLEPSFLVIENVPGIAVAFDKAKRRQTNPRGLGRPALAYSDRIAKRLDQIGYDIVGLQESAAEFGVPQSRTRYLMIGVRRETGLALDAATLRRQLFDHRDRMLNELNLEWPVTLEEAISDLTTRGKKRVACADSRGFKQIRYEGPQTRYQKLMRSGMRPDEAPNSMRLANHRPATVARLKEILATCRQGVRLSAEDREWLDLGKTGITPLAPDKPAKTLTSLPDDFVHYSEPRIMTVREHARIQSFPDWFSFHGKYTTGGLQRRLDVPRYTQVANAVPPLLAQIIGRTLLDLYSASTVPTHDNAGRVAALKA